MPEVGDFCSTIKCLLSYLLKQSPKAYKVLRGTFALPSRKTLMNLLNKIKFTTGIVPKVMKTQAFCTEPSLVYDKKWDNIVGFQDMNGSRSLRFADHALVFMLQGLRKKRKQPISFYFSQGGMNSHQLKDLIKSTIVALQEISFIIACTVCTCYNKAFNCIYVCYYSANVNAIKKLKEETAKGSSSDRFVPNWRSRGSCNI